MREAQEETGLDPAGVVPFATLPDLWVPVSDYVVTPVVAWWREHAEMFPKLSGMARSILGARVTSANIERTFSQARGLVSPLRTRLTAEHIELWMLNKLNRCLAQKQ